MRITNNYCNEAVSSILNKQEERLNNKFYQFQENYIFGTYYNISDEHSTNGDGHELAESYIGDSSPLKYNKILNVPIYGFSSIDIDISRNEFGIEGDGITGEIYLLPNTVIPVPEDRFTLNHLKGLLFRVLSTTTMKLDNGSNMWRVSYKLDNPDINNTKIEEKVIKTYNIVNENIGTELKCVVEENKYNMIKRIEYIMNDIKIMYLNAFYRSNVDSLILYHNGVNIYDPMLTQFIIENRLIEDEDIDMILYHQLPLNDDFKIHYNRSIFNKLKSDKIELFRNVVMNLKPITSRMSIFVNDPEDYYMVEYNDNIIIPYNQIPEDLEMRFKGNEVDNTIVNIAYNFLSGNVSEFDIEYLENISVYNEHDLYYGIPVLIFSVNKYIKSLIM